ncbi:MAG TPA: hypothetical protein PKC13_17150, partial [Blastocatellia bacterium]|nr:hypothetical protein [Blastocatellia bacterium]
MSEISIYRRKGKALRLQETLRYSDTLTSPLLPGFKCTVKSIFDVYIEVGSSADANDSADNNSIH